MKTMGIPDGIPIIGLTQTTVMQLVDGSENLVAEWDRVIRSILGLSNTQRYLIVDIGVQLDAKTYVTTPLYQTNLPESNCDKGNNYANVHYREGFR